MEYPFLSIALQLLSDKPVSQICRHATSFYPSSAPNKLGAFKAAPRR